MSSRCTSLAASVVGRGSDFERPGKQRQLWSVSPGDENRSQAGRILYAAVAEGDYLGCHLCCVASVGCTRRGSASSSSHSNQGTVQSYKPRPCVPCCPYMYLYSTALIVIVRRIYIFPALDDWPIPATCTCTGTCTDTAELSLGHTWIQPEGQERCEAMSGAPAEAAWPNDVFMQAPNSSMRLTMSRDC